MTIKPEDVSFYIPDIERDPREWSVMHRIAGTWYIENRLEIALECCRVKNWSVRGLVQPEKGWAMSKEQKCYTCATCGKRTYFPHKLEWCKVDTGRNDDRHMCESCADQAYNAAFGLGLEASIKWGANDQIGLLTVKIEGEK